MTTAVQNTAHSMDDSGTAVATCGLRGVAREIRPCNRALEVRRAGVERVRC